MIRDQLNYLTPAELSILGDHLKLGLSHIKEYLTDQEIKELLDSAPLGEYKKDHIQYTEGELSGNLSLILHSSISTIFGIWLGYSAFLGFRISSPLMLSLAVLLATGLGFFTVYQSTQLTKEKSRKAIQTEKLHRLQLDILSYIEQKKTEEKEGLIKDLNALIISLSSEASDERPFSFIDLEGKSKPELLNWASQLEKTLQERLTLSHESSHVVQLPELYQDFRRHLIECFEKTDELAPIHSEDQAQNERKLSSPLRKLINTFPLRKMKHRSWLQSQGRDLFLGLIPTVLGGFSSLTVYLSGVPNILKNFGLEHWANFLSDPNVKTVELCISLLITLYFGVSFIYPKYKEFIRNQELAKTEKLIIQKEAGLKILDAYSGKLKNLKSCMEQLSLLFTQPVS